jgi:serine/threonine-protein kinase HipA
MSCHGCYRPGTDMFCLPCRKLLFNGRRVSPILDFESPKDSNLAQFQEKTKRLSISGVQLKYSVRLEENALKLTDISGQYILKPIPPSAQLSYSSQAPENEHLTMQIASRVYGIETAVNGFLKFKDGAPAYITRRFDLAPDGSRYQQEDFAQLSGRTKNTHGENFKYNSTYEEIGMLIKQYIAAALPALENYFRLVLFNYIFSNGDAHLKNFSIIRTTYGDYMLTPAYDLMCTVLHTSLESDMALDLYTDDHKDEFYSTHGYYGRPSFEELARRIGLLPKRAATIINNMINKSADVKSMIDKSFLDIKIKELYFTYYLEKLRRFNK